MLVGAIALCCLSQSSDVTVIQRKETTLDVPKAIAAMAKDWSKRTELKTYLMQPKGVTDRDIAEVKPYVASTTVLAVARLELNGTWTFWAPNGANIETPKYVLEYPPFKKPGKLFLIVNQELLSGYQDYGFESVDCWRECGGTGDTYKNEYHDRHRKWVEYMGDPAPYIDVNFQVTHRVPMQPELKVEKGSAATVEDLQFKVVNLFETERDGVAKGEITIRKTGTGNQLMYVLQTDIDWSENDKRFGPVNGQNEDMFKPGNANTSLNGFNEKTEANLVLKFPTRLRNVKKITITKHVVSYGFFGHIASWPDSDHRPRNSSSKSGTSAVN